MKVGQDWMLKTNVSLVSKPQNTRSMVNLTSALCIAKYFETHVNPDKLWCPIFPQLQLNSWKHYLWQHPKSCPFFSSHPFWVAPCFMDGNGEAAGRFQLKVGGLFYRFPGTSVQVEQNRCFTIAFQIFNGSLPICLILVSIQFHSPSSSLSNCSTNICLFNSEDRFEVSISKVLFRSQLNGSQLLDANLEMVRHEILIYFFSAQQNWTLFFRILLTIFV